MHNSPGDTSVRTYDGHPSEPGFEAEILSRPDEQYSANSVFTQEIIVWRRTDYC